MEADAQWVVGWLGGWVVLCVSMTSSSWDKAWGWGPQSAAYLTPYPTPWGCPLDPLVALAQQVCSTAVIPPDRRVDGSVVPIFVVVTTFLRSMRGGLCLPRCHEQALGEPRGFGLRLGFRASGSN